LLMYLLNFLMNSHFLFIILPFIFIIILLFSSLELSTITYFFFLFLLALRAIIPFLVETSLMWTSTPAIHPHLLTIRFLV
jgi:hypothetical protein